MKVQNFLIADTQFEMPILDLSDNFIVKSMPANYHVTCYYDSNPLEFVKKLLTDSDNLLIIDNKVLEYFGKDVKLDTSKIYTVNATEEVKTLEEVDHCFEFLLKNKVTKDMKIIVVGGGIVQEMASFAAKCYKRGIKWLFFPTTLLAMCDSCIGGKSSLNYKGVKNQLGLFSPPTEVFINIYFLSSLTLKDLKSGLGEILKVCIMAGENALKIYKLFIADALKGETAALKKLILLALKIKQAVIEVDEFDNHERKALNYGHTIGHIIEGLTDFQVPHGLAIVAGLVFANYISLALNLMTRNHVDEIDKLCFDLLDDNTIDKIGRIDSEKIFDLLATDKKIKNKKLQLILLKAPSIIDFFDLNLESERDKILMVIRQVLNNKFNRENAV